MYVIRHRFYLVRLCNTAKKVIIKAAAAAPIDAPPPLRAAIDRSTTNSAQILPEINTNAPFKPSGASQTPPSGPPPPSDIAQPPPTDVPPLPSKSITLSREHSTVGETTTSDLQSLASATKASPVATGVRNEPPAQMANSAPNGTPSRQDIPAIRGDHSQRSLPQKPPGESVTSPRSPRGLHADPQMMNLPIASAPPPPSDVPAPPTLHRGASRENYVVETSTQPPKSTNSAPNNGSVEGTPTPLRTRELVPSKSTPNMAGKLVSSSSPIPPSHALHESSSSLGTGEKSTEARNGPPSRGNTPSRGVFTKGAPRSSPVPPGNRRALPTPSGARETLTRPVTQPREATSPLANPGAPSPAAPHKNVPHQASPTTASSRSGAMPSLPRSQSPGGSKASESSSTVFSDRYSCFESALLSTTVLTILARNMQARLLRASMQPFILTLISRERPQWLTWHVSSKRSKSTLIRQKERS